jgi:hypothetical protein
MQTIELTQASDSAGTLHVHVPGQDPNREYRVVVLVEPKRAETQTLRDERGWPNGFFDRLAGSWQGEFPEAPEGEFEQRSSL